MRFPSTLRKAGEFSIALAFLSPLIFAGCGGGSSKTNSTAYSSVVQLFGSNGDMNKYVGVWASGCGSKMTWSPSNTTFDGVINKFSFTAVSGASVQGTLTNNTYPGNVNCSGGGVQNIYSISLTYASNVNVASQVNFTGTADQVEMRTVGASGVTAYNFAFRQGFGAFQIESVGYNFSTTNLLYHKQ